MPRLGKPKGQDKDKNQVERLRKKRILEGLETIFGQASLVVLVHQHGMTVRESEALRARAREAGVGFRVVKNRLARLALQGQSGGQDGAFEGLQSRLSGPTALAYSRDTVAAARVAVECARENEKIKVQGGSWKNQYLSAQDIEALATLPDLDSLRGQLTFLLQAPAVKLARLTREPAAVVARVLKARAEAGAGAGAGAE